MPESDSIKHPPWLTGGDFTLADEPLRLFAAWYEEAVAREPDVPNAMALATVDADGMPNVRMVLMKGFDPQGFVFYTNVESPKGRELDASHKAALLFPWKSLNREIRLRGAVERVSDSEADAYFATRARLAQIGAWASKQSAPLESRLAFETSVARVTARYPLGAIPRPPFWSGFRVAPLAIEFWHDRPFRLHDRIAFTRSQTHETWTRTRLYP